ncbi:MAG: ATP-binding protein [Planctomycetota bacterium]|jgi:signal transduction histidine kinase
MMVPIRLKLALLLIVVAVLPLVVVLVATAWWGHDLQAKAIGNERQSTAQAQAMGLRVSLVKDIQKLAMILQDDPLTTDLLRRQREALSPIELADLDTMWPHLSDGDAEVARALQNPVAERLRAFQINDPRTAEILLTDGRGELVAATGRTEDYYQADEDWWQECFADGKGAIHIPAIHMDISSGVWSVDLCLPIMEGGKVIGIAKASVDVSEWFRGTEALIGSREMVGRLVDRDGRIIFPPPGPGPAQYVAEWDRATADGDVRGWRRIGPYRIQAYAPVDLPAWLGQHPVRQAERWVVVLDVSQSTMLADIRELTWWLLIGGLIFISLLFIAGLYVVDQSVARRIRRLTAVARKVGGGDLSVRVDVAHWTRHMIGRDELDDLAQQFNDMVQEVERSHAELHEANELKARFIKVAGHELRTPVSYIMTLPKLVADTDDVEKLRRGFAAMEGKAGRLNDIIQAIFKLMPEQDYSGSLRLSDVKTPELLAELYEDVKPFVDERHQTLVVDAADALPTVRMDRYKIHDVIENLIGNAIKFTPDGKTIHVTATKQLGETMAISVIDQGPGISDEDMRNLFDPFFSTSDVMKHSSGSIGYQKRGMGLGLAVVKHFTEMHGGTVHVQTTPEGSTFTVVLPIAGPPTKE